MSINPCTDAILMHIADPSQIAAISHYSKDPRATSIPLATAAKYPATSGTAEEVMAHRPDVVIAGAHVSPATANALQRLGIRLVTVPVPTTIAESLAQIRTLAAATGHPARGEALIARINTAIARARTTKPPLPALIWQSGGLVPGQATLATNMLKAAGFTNASVAYGLKTWDVLPLEPLINTPPKLLLTSPARDDRMLSHPALKRLALTRRPFPDRLLFCGGPTIIPALAQLTRIRATL